MSGIRQDAWANKNRISVEERKSEKERGHYLHPQVFGVVLRGNATEQNIGTDGPPRIAVEYLAGRATRGS